MKKLLASLLIFSTTGAMIAGTVSLKNNVTKSRLSALGYIIDCIVTDKNGTSKKITIKDGEQAELGTVSSIAKIEISQNLTAQHPFGEYSTYLPAGYAAEKMKGVDNITNEFLAATRGRENDDFLIKVEWKYPNSYTSREWKYTFENLSRF